jgi:uncharacterized metal-binding protein YceD (DUF177 family)
MRITVTTIPFSGMKVDAPIGLDALNNRLKEGERSPALAFQAAPMADLTLTRTHGGILVKGLIAGLCKQECSTCADPVEHEVSAYIDWVLQTASDRAAPNDEIDDPGVIIYDGEHVDLEEPLQEALILSLSPFWHPERDEHERCRQCDRDCSARRWQAEEPEDKKTTAFGAMFKSALTKQRR